jgi:hypothetical protein
VARASGRAAGPRRAAAGQLRLARTGEPDGGPAVAAAPGDDGRRAG